MSDFPAFNIVCVIVCAVRISCHYLTMTSSLASTNEPVCKQYTCSPTEKPAASQCRENGPADSCSESIIDTSFDRDANRVPTLSVAAGKHHPEAPESGSTNVHPAQRQVPLPERRVVHEHYSTLNNRHCQPIFQGMAVHPGTHPDGGERPERVKVASGNGMEVPGHLHDVRASWARRDFLQAVQKVRLPLPIWKRSVFEAITPFRIEMCRGKSVT
jgi:hypothetical protein